MKKKQEELKQEWEQFEPEQKETGENRKEIIKKGLENLKIKESNMKIPLVDDQKSFGSSSFSEKDALEQLKDKPAGSNPGGLSDDELARRN